ncbi:MAG: PAS domain-containing protein [Phycisphaerae bacterium]|nr:PAS domain-containing protein [Phycisphaerae bacterium]
MISERIKSWIRTELFDQVPVSICVIDRDLRIVEANRTFTETFGPWHDQHCFAVYKNRTERCEDCAAATTFSDGKTRNREEQGPDASEGKPTHYLVHMVPLIREDGEVRYIIEMSTDISEMKRLQQEKLTAERLAAVGQTVAGLAHGIKNVTMGLEGGMYVLNSGIKRNSGDRMQQGLEMLDSNIARISSFVKEFLDFAKGRTPHVALVDPNRIAREVTELFRGTAARSGIRVQAKFDESIAKAPLDEEGIHTCLTNLVSNALDACEMSNKEDRCVTVTTREADGTLVYEVADDGCGMEYDVKQKVFTGFFSTKESGKGTGLGLLTTRKIVQEHGGKISFESAEEEGSVFRLEFPRSRLPEPTGKVDAEKDA